jgi:transcriptional regulator with XRE-family HTH domain
MDKKRDRMMDHQPFTDGSDNVFFGQWLRQCRRSLDLTQDALAQRVGCVVDTVRKIELGMRRPSRAMAERLAQCLSIPVEQRAGFLAAARADRAPQDLAATRIPPPGVAPALVSIIPRSGHLPAPMTSFIGREWEVTTVGTRLRTPEVRLVTHPAGAPDRQRAPRRLSTGCLVRQPRAAQRPDPGHPNDRAGARGA